MGKITSSYVEVKALVWQNENEDEDGMVATCVSRLWPLQLESVAWLDVGCPTPSIILRRSNHEM